ncbi:MAG: antitermination protein NusB [Desulfovibrio sp.]|nr:antitermination protein NusB [Desulfovibrio sp.]
MPQNSALPNVRKLCLKVLLRLDQGQPIQEALAKEQERASLEPKDRQLLTELCYGVLRTEIRLAFILDQFLSQRKKLPPAFCYILFLAVYSRLFLERIPVHAVLSTSVSLVKELFGQKLANLANAVLRNFESRRAIFLAPKAYLLGEDQPNEQPLLALARFYALPSWLLKFWLEHYGLAKTLALARRSLTRPRLGLLFAPSPEGRLLHADLACALKSQKNEFTALGALGFALESQAFQQFFAGQDFAKLHQAGLFSFQSPGSQMVIEALGLRKWTRPFWDMCAGYGGKSAALVEAGIPLALATDTSALRLSGLARDFQRRNLPPPNLALADATKPPLSSFSGNILLDAPCSGLGILARRPDLRRHRKNKRSLRLFPKQQRALCLSAISLLARGCELAYITCTPNPLENELLLEQILADFKELTLLATWQTPANEERCEGMYGALVRRN